MLKDLNLPIFICGSIASGKSTFAKNIAKQLNYEFIEVSDIVRRITKEATRDKINNLPDLDETIIDELKAFVKKHKDRVVVCGVRQVTILEAFEKGKLELFPIYYWLDIPRNVRLERYLNRKDAKDGSCTLHSFNKASALDIKLGIKDVETYCKEYRKQIQTEIDNLKLK